MTFLTYYDYQLPTQNTKIVTVVNRRHHNRFFFEWPIS